MFKSIAFVCCLLFAADAAAAPIVGLKSGLFEPPRVAPPIGLRASDGSAFDLARYRGKVVVLEFGFINCGAVCPATLASLAQARKLLGTDAARLQVVFVTVDPARDSVVRLHDYLAQFDPGFIGVSGGAQQVDAVLKAYGVTATKQMAAGSKTEYTMAHSSYLYFVDRGGMLRALMPFGRPAAEIAHDARLLLRN
ncbi:MAG: electron transport protein SCO1/SenC [Massilia sp.]|nr:electron transport protein SCO1/SenC [Massilia sp.]